MYMQAKPGLVLKLAQGQALDVLLDFLNDPQGDSWTCSWGLQATQPSRPNRNFTAGSR